MNSRIAADPLIEAVLDEHPIVAFSVSGGKDSAAATVATNDYLDARGHPRARRVLIHADLGAIEWRSTPEQVASLAKRTGLELIIARRQAGGLIERWQQRFANGKARYTKLETYNLIGPWSSSALRFCTSEMKAQVIGPELRRRYAGQTIVSVVGLRRAESASRAQARIATIDTRFAKPGNAAGTRMLTWHPIIEWSDAEVFAFHEERGLALHEAYWRWDATRMGCTYCVLASLRNLAASARAPDNHEVFRRLVAIEIASTFSFQSARWLGDVAPELLDSGQAHRLAEAKQAANLRRSHEASLPADLRFQKGWPPRVPTTSEAARIAEVRARILGHHGLPNLYPRAGDVIARFAELREAA